jgi:Family of unknown function (DUF6680)
MPVFLGIDLAAWLTMVAIVSGPIAAIRIDRFLQKQKESRERKIKLFRELMATRGTRLLPRHVEALNLITVEYSRNDSSEFPVFNAWKNYHAHLNDKIVKGKGESTEAYEARSTAWINKQINLLTELLKAMAKHLGYAFDDVEIRDGGYWPQGWTNVEGEQNRVRQLLLEILEGKRAFPVTPFDVTRHQ